MVKRHYQPTEDSLIPTLGMEVEYFLYVCGTLARASNFAPGYDSNDSIGELRSTPHYYVEEVFASVQHELQKIAKHILNKQGLFVALATDLHFKPYAEAMVTYREYGLTVPIAKTAGIHLHTSNLRRSAAEMQEILVKHRLLCEELGEECQKRMKAAVIGPSSGNVYRYGDEKRFWQYKGGETGAEEHYEFRPFASSLVALDIDLLDLAFRFICPHITMERAELERLIEGLSTSVVRPLMSFLPQGASVIRTYKTPHSVLFLDEPEIRVMQQGVGADLTIFTYRTEEEKLVADAFATPKFPILTVAEQDYARLVQELEEGDGIQAYARRKVDATRYCEHRIPPTGTKERPTEFISSKHTDLPEYEALKDKVLKRDEEPIKPAVHDIPAGKYVINMEGAPAFLDADAVIRMAAHRIQFLKNQ